MSNSLPRITARIDEETQELLMRAAALDGSPSLNAYIIKMLRQSAEKTIQEANVWQMDRDEAAAFVEALDNPPAMNERLSRAFDRFIAMEAKH